MLEARNGSPNALSVSAAAPPATDVSATAQFAPHQHRSDCAEVDQRLQPSSVSTSDFNTKDLAASSCLLHLLVDEKGMPQNVQLIKSANPQVDSRVLAAVRRYQFVPASLDEQSVPLELDLRVNFQPR